MPNVLKPEGQKPLQRPRSRWNDSIKMDLNEIGYEGSGLGSFGSEYRPVAGSSEHDNEPLGPVKG
jgi:hypothetical protein